MQTTLLGVAFALILALVAALVGPLFVDWSAYRGEFEARASRLTGLDFHVTGAIDARLLPTPIVVLQGVEFGRPRDAGKVRARTLRIEFALAALLRGEWRIAEARLEGPEFEGGLNGSGQLAWPVPKLDVDLDSVAIDRLQIEDGRAVLGDAASGSRLLLENLDFRGEVRALSGPVKGEGSFAIAGQRYPYRLSTSRIAADGGMKVRLAISPTDQPVTADADLTVWIERGKPRFEGGIQFGRTVARAPAGGQALLVDSWHVSSRLKGDSSAAGFEQIEFQYGPDDRAIKLKGNANLRFGQQPQMTAALSSPQIDVDRLLALPEATQRRPAAAIRLLADAALAASRLPIPAAVSIGVENVTLGGAMLTRIGAEAKIDADGLDIKALELRAPGATQVGLSGRLDQTARGPQFKGSARVEATDPRTFLAWLTERDDQPATAAAGMLRLAGDISLGSDAFGVEQLNLELDRMTVRGRVGYAWATNDHPARLDVALAAPEIDFDRVQALATALLGDTTFDWPREGALALKIDRSLIAGIEAKQADVNLRIGADGVQIERLTLGDFGGAALTITGRIDSQGQAPRGALAFDLNARALDGLTAVLERLAPQAAEQLRRVGGRIAPVALRGSLSLDPTPSTPANAKIKLDGRAGSFRIAAQGDVDLGGDGFKLNNPAALGAAKVDLAGHLDAEDGAALTDLLALDRFIAVEKRPGKFALTAKGSLDGQLALDGQLSVGALTIAADGTLRARGDAGPTAGLNVRVVNASVRSPRPVAAGRGADLVPVSLAAGVDLIDGRLHLTDLSATVAGASVRGRLALGLWQKPVSVDGELDLGAANLPALVATAIGIPTPSAAANASGLWPAEPFDQDALRLSGHVAVKAARVAFTPKLSAKDVRGAVHFGEKQLAFQVADGSVAGGRLVGELVFLRDGEGLIARNRVAITGANAAELLPGDGVLGGRLTVNLSTEGSGMSPVALMGSLTGSGTFKLENGRAVRLDPTAFDSVTRAVDQGLPIDAVRIRDRMEAALASGVLSLPLAEGMIIVEAGQARLGNVTVQAQRADLAVNGSVNLADAALDARLTLFGAGGAGAPANTRPEVLISLKGPVDAPKRSTDVSALASWLALRAVEQQAKKLDVLEGRAPSASSPRPAANGPRVPAQEAPIAEPPGPAATQSEPATPSDSQAVRPQPTTGTPKPAAPAAERAPPLPPPIDIRPAPAPRPPRTQQGAQATPGQPQQQRPAAAPAPPRPPSLSEFFFGR